MATTILGISPGTRIIGIGVIQNGELVEWQVKTFKGSWSQEKLSLILGMIQGLCEFFSVDTIALKAVSPLRSSPHLVKLTNQIITLSDNIQVSLLQLSIHDLKWNAGRHGKNSIAELMEFMTEQYPVLKRAYLKERNNLNPYYLKMFEAIAAAHYADDEK